MEDEEMKDNDVGADGNRPDSQGSNQPGANNNNNQLPGLNLNYNNVFQHVDYNVDDTETYEIILKKIDNPKELAAKLFSSDFITASFPKAKDYHLTPFGDIKFVYNNRQDAEAALKTKVTHFGRNASLKPIMKKFKYEIMILSLPVKTKDEVLLKYLENALPGAKYAKWTNNNANISNLVISFENKIHYESALKLKTIKIGHRFYLR